MVIDATARLIAGPRAGLIAAVALALCGAWYGAMFNHTKDIPFAAAMTGVTLFLVRILRQMPLPRIIDVAALGVFAGAALGVRSLGLLLFVYLGLAIVICLPWRESGGARLRFATSSALRTFPGVALALLIMILAWPWAALSPLNPIRGLFAFSEFHYAIRTMFAGSIYEMKYTQGRFSSEYYVQECGKQFRAIFWDSSRLARSHFRQRSLIIHRGYSNK